ncbi:hypothetical protein CEP52_014495 [Fusarium oligoseptatum]|uniref:DNA2/NAM7 helicase-like C-terminal domain-containing protein n=1 Tax=Fusarium oligoseptatum TaxID=2604345 RepID=A0A428SLS4_9HYPO|nr:hypothetical protein CEP52_014495 [Fusarium oligoseptatum]
MSKHNWKDERYDMIIPRNLGIGFSVATEFENQNNLDTALEQIAIDARFIKLDKDQPTKDNTHFLLVVNMDDQASPSHRDGRPFFANQNRICVGITRQVGACFIIGDIDTTPPYTGFKENGRAQEGDDGEAEFIKPKVF